MTAEEIEALAVLAGGIIPADETDSGAAAVDAGSRLARRVDEGVNASLYLNGLRLAEATSLRQFATGVAALTPPQVHDLLAVLRAEMPGFFKQLRMDVCALYLSDPAVWERIGFPGPSTESGGYPDFDRPQGAIGNHP